MKTPYSKERAIEDGHWKHETYTQRLTTREWKLVLLHTDDHITFEGRVRKLVAKKLGYGVVEISKLERSK